MDHRGTERRSACWMFVVLLSCVSSSWNSAVAGEDAGGQALIGTPTSVAIGPESPPLRGRHSTRQMIATGRYANGSVRDLTRLLFWTNLDPAVATVSDRGQVFPRGNGTATIVARHGSIESSAVVKVQQMDQPAPVSFRRDVIPAFSQAGCNTGACHGAPTGKGGFRLSLRGYLPDQDFLTLSREAGGRRINIMATESSLLLTKPLGEVAHEGGLRLSRNSKSYELLRDWIKEGARDDPTAPAPVKLEIVPESRVLNAPARSQQLVVLLHLADGSIRDVTPICYYDTSSPEIAEVDPDAYFRFKNRGEVAVIAHYLNLVANIRLTHLVEVPGFKPAQVPRDDVVDNAVFSKLNRMRISPSGPCTDQEFIRRVYLDTIGILPTPQEVQEFVSSGRGGRRDQVIDRLLGRPEFYDFWALKFADILRSNGRLIQPKGAYVFHRWIRAALERNMPMDWFVRMLLTTDGSTYSNPATNYQLSSHTNELNADDNLYFSHALTKLLPAEVLLDAISTVTGTTTAFEGLPQGSRATQMPDGKMDNPFLKTFGRPARELACECERESDSNLSQALQLIGGATVNGKLHDDNGRIAQLAKSGKSPEAITRDLYLVALGRTPTAAELAAATKHLKAETDLRAAVEDLGWVLINSKEFLFRH